MRAPWPSQGQLRVLDQLVSCSWKTPPDWLESAIERKLQLAKCKRFPSNSEEADLHQGDGYVSLMTDNRHSDLKFANAIPPKKVHPRCLSLFKPDDHGSRGNQ